MILKHMRTQAALLKRIICLSLASQPGRARLYVLLNFDDLDASIPTYHDTIPLLSLDLVVDYAIDSGLDRFDDEAVVGKTSYLYSLSLIEIGIRENKWIDMVLNES